MTLETLCKRICLPCEVTVRVLTFPAVPDPVLALLRTPGRWDEGRGALADFLDEDPDGFGTLAQFPFVSEN